MTTTPAHDPLTPEHLALLDAAPFEVTVTEMQTDKYWSATFLQQLGYLAAEQTYISENAANNRFNFTRTLKPLP
jgi:hypothetical protein